MSFGGSRTAADAPQSVRASLLGTAIPSLGALDAAAPHHCTVPTPHFGLDLPGRAGLAIRGPRWSR
jgi:hypothetical protein